MQNSGLSNALNPIISIAHKKVYSIPLILIIGWRGSPRLNDEPQHNVKGNITEKLLKLLNIKYTILRSQPDLKKFDKKIKLAKKNKALTATANQHSNASVRRYSHAIFLIRNCTTFKNDTAPSSFKKETYE